MQQWWISAWWDCDVWRKVDFIQQPATTSSVVRLSAPKHFPKPNLYQKKDHSHCLVTCCLLSTMALWILMKSLHVRSMFSKSMRRIKNCNAYAEIGQQNGPNSSPGQHPTTHCTINTSKVEWIGLWSFASSTLFIWPLANWLPLLQASWQLLAEKMLPQPAGGRKCFPKFRWIPKHGFLCYRNK